MEPTQEKLLSNMEIDAIGEILNISLGSSATSVSELLGQPVNITTPEVRLMKTSEFDIKTYEPAIAVEINYVEGLSGKNMLILKESDVKVIVGLLLQTDFSDTEFVLDEMNVGAICEVMNQMMGAASTALSQFLNRKINISPPNSFPIGNSEQFKKQYFEDEENICAVYFNLMIGDLISSDFIFVMPIELAKELVSYFGLTSETETRSETGTVLEEKPIEREEPQMPNTSFKDQSEPEKAEQAPADSFAPVVPDTPQPQPESQPQIDRNIKKAHYQSFDDAKPPLTKEETNNLNMIMSVPLQVTVEIGRTSKKIKDILDFSVGSIVELDKQAGSQVDVYVNGKAIAKGNVVVVDDFYGVRITEVINSDEIMKLV